MKPIKIYRSRPAHLRNGNFGDELTDLLIGRLFGRTTIPVRMEEAELIGAGSILDAYWRRQRTVAGRRRLKLALYRLFHRSPRYLHVWGSGAMLEASGFEWRQELIIEAVRGELTARRLGNRAPAVLGDPGILAPLLVDKAPRSDAEVALVPHFVDEIVAQSLELPRHWKLVHTDRDAVQTIEAIAASDLVISSSLHGLITADAFGIPCIWARSHNDLYKRSDFKFHDHASARGAAFNGPLTYRELLSLSPARLSGIATVAARDLDAWREELFKACPVHLIQ